MRLKSKAGVVNCVVAIGATVAMVLSQATTVSAALLGMYDRPAASLVVTAERWNPGSPIHIYGEHFSPGEMVEINFTGLLASANANEAGVFDTDATVPWADPGGYQLTAIGEDSGRRAEFAFPIQAFNPWAEPSSYWVPVGTALNFSGHRFANGERIDVMLDGNVVTTGTADQLGEFVHEGCYTVPRSKFGQQLQFALLGINSGALTTFTVGVANWPVPPLSQTFPDLCGATSPEPEPEPEPSPGPPSGSPTPVTLQTDEFVPMLAGQAFWQALEWKGGDYDVCDFKVTVITPDSSVVQYPSSQSWSGLSRDTQLNAGEIDFTAIHVRVSPNAVDGSSYTATATYTPCDGGAEQSTVETVRMPVADINGQPFVQDTHDVGVFTQGSSRWVPIYFSGRAPNLTDFRVKVVGPVDASITYPNEGTYTTPALEHWIDPGMQDYVAFRIDTTGLQPGVHVLTLSITYGDLSSPVVTTGVISFEVVGI